MSGNHLVRAATLTAVAIAVTGWGAQAAADPGGPESPPPNQLIGTWRMESAVSDPGGPAERHPYGSQPDGLLTFNANGTFVEVLQSTEIPPFANDQRIGTPEENAAVVAGTLGQHGTYTVDSEGAYASNVIVGSSWPNRNGVEYRPPVLTLTVTGDRLTEVLAVPGRPRLVIEFARVP